MPILIATLGLKVQGGAIGADNYCIGVFQKQINKILVDLASLEQILHLHLRVKQAVYCCNGRVSYFLWLVQLPVTTGPAQRFNTAMAEFFCRTLLFPRSKDMGAHEVLYMLA